MRRARLRQRVPDIRCLNGPGQTPNLRWGRFGEQLVSSCPIFLGRTYYSVDEFRSEGLRTFHSNKIRPQLRGPVPMP